MIKPSLRALALLLLASCSTGEPPPRPRQQALAPVPPIIAEETAAVSRGVVSNTVPAIRVAFLVPLSGESTAVGNAMMDAATMALYDSYLNTPSDQIRARVILLPKDTRSTPADAKAATKQALEQGSSFIIGPLFSQSVGAVAPLAREKKVSMLTFSNTQEVAQQGIYTFGFLPEQQVERLAEFAYLQNIQRVAVLAPNDSYGQKIQDTLASEFQKRGGRVTPRELYAPNPININAAVARLAAAYTETPEDQRFQAIFIADGGYNLRNVITALKRSSIDLSKIKLLGTGLWDDPDVAKIPEMEGAWFASAPPGLYTRFEQQFTGVYGYKPVRLASLAYDAVMLAAQLAMYSPDGSINEAALVDPNGYHSPANGLVRLRPDGTSERKLAVLEITQGAFRVIDNAPKQFDNSFNVLDRR